MLNKNQLRNAVLDNRCVFFVLPTKELKDRIINLSDEKINSLSSELKAFFLEDKGFYVENEMIAKYIDGSLDDSNFHLLSMCDIRVMQDTIKIN
jgi:hypothetical protein